MVQKIRRPLLKLNHVKMSVPKMILNDHTFCFCLKTNVCNIILKTEQTTIVHAQQDRYVSHDMIKHHMITTDVISIWL